MGKAIKGSTIKIYKGMSLYKVERSDFFWGYLNVSGVVKKKSLGTNDKKEAEKLLFEWKSDLMTDKNSKIGEAGNSFSHYAQKLLERERRLPPRPSGVEQYQDTKTLLERTNGLIDYFGNRDISTITNSDIEKFFDQLPLDNKPLTIAYLKKHKNLLKKILDSANRTDVIYPKLRGKKSEPRGYFTYKEYKELLSGIKKLYGTKFKTHNGSRFEITEEINSFIIFLVGSMLRPTVSEVYSLKFEDIKVRTIKDTKYLEFVIDRKNRKMKVQTLSTSYFAYKSILEQRPKHSKSDYLFAPQYENRRTAMRYMSNMFKHVLDELGMSKGDLGESRTLYSLRHTSLIFNLSQPNVDLLDIARRADTSMKMIEDFYYPQSQLEEKLVDFLRLN